MPLAPRSSHTFTLTFLSLCILDHGNGGPTNDGNTGSSRLDKAVLAQGGGGVNELKHCIRCRWGRSKAKRPLVEGCILRPDSLNEKLSAFARVCIGTAAQGQSNGTTTERKRENGTGIREKTAGVLDHHPRARTTGSMSHECI